MWVEDEEKGGVEVKLVMGKMELERGKGVEGYLEGGEGGGVKGWERVRKEGVGVGEGNEGR